MPDAETLKQMYGDDYGQFLSVDHAHTGDAGTQKVLELMKKLGNGTFLDYGCGAGKLISEVSALGWKSYGIEFNRSMTDQIAGTHEAVIAGNLEEIPAEISFDAIHFGDVVEHLTDVNVDMPKVLARLTKNGVLIAQGPLEANFNVFLLGLRLKRMLRSSDSSMPPYHVSLATAKGQKSFFSRFGLQEIIFEIVETAHPAPERLTFGGLRSIRLTSLFLLRKTSQAISRTVRSSMGNRYFYAGRKIG
jgi:SAM-dependent methyltransferase